MNVGVGVGVCMCKMKKKDIRRLNDEWELWCPVDRYVESAERAADYAEFDGLDAVSANNISCFFFIVES